MKITSVEPQKKNSKRFNIFLDGKFTFGADEDLVVNFRLLPGKEIDQELLEKLIFEAEIGKLMERMYGLFSIRQRSEKEILDYLKRLSFKRKIKGDEEISDLVKDLLIERLKKKSLVNDVQFAADWVRARRISRKKGNIAIRAELFNKGIDKAVIEEAFSSQSLALSQEDIAMDALEKKVRLWQNLSKLEFKQKAFSFLMRKGFEYEVSRIVVEKFIQKMYNSNN